VRLMLDHKVPHGDIKFDPLEDLVHFLVLRRWPIALFQRPLYILQELLPIAGGRRWVVDGFFRNLFLVALSEIFVVILAVQDRHVSFALSPSMSDWVNVGPSLVAQRLGLSFGRRKRRFPKPWARA
jgi:hypothetical protein